MQYDISFQKKIISDFLNSNRQTMCINGEYGSGKTFLIDKFIEENPQYKYVTISTYSSYLYDDYIEYIYYSLNKKINKLKKIVFVIAILIAFFIIVCLKLSDSPLSLIISGLALFLSTYQYFFRKLNSIEKTERIDSVLSRKCFIRKLLINENPVGKFFINHPRINKFYINRFIVNSSFKDDRFVVFIFDDIDRGIKEDKDKILKVLDYLSLRNHLKIILLGDFQKLVEYSDIDEKELHKYISNIYNIEDSVRIEILYDIKKKIENILSDNEVRAYDTKIYEDIIAPLLKSKCHIRSLLDINNDLDCVPGKVNLGEYILLIVIMNTFPNAYIKILNEAKLNNIEYIDEIWDKAFDEIRSGTRVDESERRSKLSKQIFGADGATSLLKNVVDTVLFNEDNTNEFAKFATSPSLYWINGSKSNLELVFEELIEKADDQVKNEASLSNFQHDIQRYYNEFIEHYEEKYQDIVDYHVGILTDSILKNYKYDNWEPHLNILYLLTDWENFNRIEQVNNIKDFRKNNKYDRLVRYKLYRLAYFRTNRNATEKNYNKLNAHILFDENIILNCLDNYDNPIIIEFLFQEKLSDEKLFHDNVGKISGITWARYFKIYIVHLSVVMVNIGIIPYNKNRKAIFIDKFADYIIDNNIEFISSAKSAMNYNICGMEKKELVDKLLEVAYYM